VTELFSQLFSSYFKQSKVSDVVEKQIYDFLDSYRSTLFVDGILPLASDFNLSAQKNELVINLTLPFPCSSELNTISASLAELIGETVRIVGTYNILPVREHNIKGIKNIIAVSSGKGGVGKSTTAVNLAAALQAEGAKVGLLDADIYGPSIPTLLGLKDQQPTSKDGKLITPLEKDGIVAMSIGFLVDDAEATVWRGPMASRAFSQLLNETDWPEIDYLIVDMPPGTGDIQLTLAQSVPTAASVIVTTPQDIALIDAIKGIAMFEKVNVPVLGIVENMSYHICESCGHHSHLFGQGGGEVIAKEFSSKLLGQLPLNIKIREQADNGQLVTYENNECEISLAYRKIAQNVAGELFKQLDMRSNENPEIEVLEV